MNEKSYLRYALYAVVVLVVAFFLWILFRDIRTTDSDAVQRVRERLEDTARQQQDAEESIDAVIERTDDSQTAADSI